MAATDYAYPLPPHNTRGLSGAALAEAKKGIRIFAQGVASTYVDGKVSTVSPLSTVTVCDNDGATHGQFKVGQNGEVTIDFVLSCKEGPGLVPMLTDYLKFHWHGMGDVAGTGDDTFEFGVASDKVHTRDLLARVCEVNNKVCPSPVSEAVAKKMSSDLKCFMFRDNFSDVAVHFEVVGPAYKPSRSAVFNETPPDVSLQTLKRYDKMVALGAIQESCLWHSEHMNNEIEKHSQMLEKTLRKHLRIDTSRGLGAFAPMKSRWPMFNERLLYPDIGKSVYQMPQEHAPVTPIIYSIVSAYNMNNLSLKDSAEISDVNMAHIMADSATFFTMDGIAAAYVMDANLADVVSGTMPGRKGTPQWSKRLTLTPTEHMSRGFCTPNVNWQTYSANDCEDDAFTIMANMKGYIRAWESHQEDEKRTFAAMDNRLFNSLTREDKEGVVHTLGRFYEMLAPLREKMAHYALPAADRVQVGKKARLGLTYTPGKKTVVEVTSVFGTALGASTDNTTGEYGGHAYVHMNIIPSTGEVAQAAAKGLHCAAENVTLEGTAHVKQLVVEKKESRVPLMTRVGADEVAAMEKGGFKVVNASSDGVVTMEKPVPIEMLLSMLENTEFMQVKGGSARRTIPFRGLSHRSQRSHAKDFASASVELDGDEEEADHCFYQDAVVMGECIVTERAKGTLSLQPGAFKEGDRLGTFFPSYTPGKEGVTLHPITGYGMKEHEYTALEQYKQDRLSEIFEPLVVDKLDADIIARWKPIQCVAKPRGDAVNDYIASVYCVTVSESSLDKETQEKQDEVASLQAAKAQTQLAKLRLPHELTTHSCIHSALRTLVFHKSVLTKEAVTRPNPKVPLQQAVKASAQSKKKKHAKTKHQQMQGQAAAATTLIL